MPDQPRSRPGQITGTGQANQSAEMVKFQGNYWAEIIEEIIVILTILGALIAFVFSLLVMKILATR